MRSLEELSALLARGEITSQMLTRSCLDAVDRREGELGAFVTLLPEEAMAAARASDHRRRQGRPLSPLDGIPCAVKDNLMTRGIRTTCASRMLETFVPPYSAHVWEKLEQAGCVLIGKTNMDEFGMGSSTEHSAFHPTRNPLDPRRVPGGSSGGSAAAVAAGMAAFALGTDTGGSIRQPAAFCKLVGLRPTWGAVSRWGLTAFASSMDQAGPLTRTCRDNAAVYGLIAGRDPRDATSREGRGRDPQKIRALVWEGMSLDLPDFACRVAGEFPDCTQALAAYYVLSSCEAASNLARYDGLRYGCRGDAREMEESCIQSRSEGFGPEVKRRIMLGTLCLRESHGGYRRALAARESLRRAFDRGFESCDVLILPVAPSGPWKLGEKPDLMDRYRQDVYTVPASLAGLPALAVGNVQLIGPAFSEPMLYRLGEALEEVALA